MAGMINEGFSPTVSATHPCSSGISAPPKIPITNKEAPWLVWAPRPVMARVKMLDHMMELINRTAKSVHMAQLPLHHTVASRRQMLTQIGRASCRKRERQYV